MEGPDLNGKGSSGAQLCGTAVGRGLLLHEAHFVKTPPERKEATAQRRPARRGSLLIEKPRQSFPQVNK